MVGTKRDGIDRLLIREVGRSTRRWSVMKGWVLSEDWTDNDARR